MANGNDDLIQQAVLRAIGSRVDSMEVDPVRAAIGRALARGAGTAPEAEGPGFLARAVDALTPTSKEEFQLIGAGILSPSIKAGQALLEIPGLFTSRNLPTDRAADFLERFDQGLMTRTEEAALQAGATPELIADSHLLGEIFGFIAPVVGSLKAARLVTGIQGPITGAGRNFVLDSAAGAIFGAALLPGEELQDRAIHALRESAIFGVGGLMLNGLVFAAQGMRFSRSRRLSDAEGLDDLLQRVANGERVILGEEGVPLAQLMSEEGFLASSLEAYSMLGRFEIEQALVESVRGAAEAGQSRGFVRSVGDSFEQVSRTVERFRDQFSGLRFDVLRGDRGFDIHFGTRGLNNFQKSQLKREGRYVGQIIEKGGTTYEYVRIGKGGRLVVNTADGQTTTIRPEGVSDLPYAFEQVELPTTGQAMYADFREFYFDRVRRAADAAGGSSEAEIVRALREGTLDLSEQNLRTFDVAGAITHPAETGLTGPQIMARALGGAPQNPARFTVEGTIRSGDDVIWVIRNRAPQGAGDLPVYFVKASDNTLVSPEVAQQLIQSGQAQAGHPPIASAEEFAQAFLQRGKVAGDLLDPPPIRSTEDAFQSWIKERGLNPSAEDVEAFRAHFNQRLRQDIWNLVPEEDMATFRRIREETLAMIDDRGLPFAALAHNKGFHVERLAEGRVSLRDINTGARLEFGDEAFAREALVNIVRSEKDPLFNYVTPGTHGMPGLTGGFGRSDGVFNFEGNVDWREFLNRLPFKGITNRRDYLDRIEQLTQIPVFSRGFAEADEAMLRLHERQAPIARRIADAWKGLNREQRVQTAEFWTAIEGSDLRGQALVRAARDAGLSSRQIRALTQSRAIFDLGAQMLGLPESRFISNYYSRIRPRTERGEQFNLSWLAGDEQAVREFQFWAEMPRTGDLPRVEMDPEIVMHEYFRGLLFKQEVAPVEKNIRKMLDMQVRDLAPDQQRAVMARALPGTTQDSFVLPDPVRSVLTEYHNNLRGRVHSGFLTMRRATTRLFSLLGMETDGRLFDQLHSTYLSMQYGAAIGARFSLANRNAVQNLWMMYTRVGGKHGTESLRRSMTQEGFVEAVTAGAIRPVEASVPHWDAVFESWVGDPTVLSGNGPLSNAFAAAIRKGLRLGHLTRKTAQKMLVPYGSSDQVNRGWAYHWQKLHTQEHLARFDAGRISWDKFLEDGLPFFSSSIKREFRTQFDRFGRERALQWIGKQAADEAHFIYGSASTPTWMQHPFGRLFGVFGQWPMWAFEMYKRRMAHATPAQIGAFWARTGALTGAFANMTIQSGIQLQPWIAPLSFEYAGGPFTDLVVQARALTEGTMEQKVTAAQNLARDFGSLIVPGQIFYQETSAAMDQNDPMQAAMMITLGRPVDKGNFAYDFVYNPEVGQQLIQDRRSPLERSLNLEGLSPVDLGGGRR